MDVQHSKLESLFELAVILGQQNDFQEILRLLSLKTATLFRAEIASILMINPRTRETIKTVVREDRESARKDFHVLQTNVVGWVMKRKQPFLSADIGRDSRFHKSIFKEKLVHSVMCVPLQSGGIIIGYLAVMSKPEDQAYDPQALSFLEKLAALAAPFLSNVQKIQEYFQVPLPDSALLAKYQPLGLLGKSPEFIEMLKAIEAAARGDVRVLLEGQSGTGKELVARAVHKLSARKNHSFVAIDCGAIPENLIESELFGHIKGAFTGAAQERKGLIEEAHNGTLFMDEINNLSYDMQAKLLRVLQEGEIRRIGSNQPVKVDVRFISASSSSLGKLVENRRFREDLYYRLHVYPISVPTLNQRREDIPLLANYFLKQFAAQQHKEAEIFHGSLLNLMKQRKWPGNIRELENFVERLVTLAEPDMTVLDQNILPPEFQKEFKKLADSKAEEQPVRKSLQENLAEYEERIIRQALAENDWNQSKAARVLQVSEQTVRYKMAKLGIVKPD